MCYYFSSILSKFCESFLLGWLANLNSHKLKVKNPFFPSISFKIFTTSLSICRIKSTKTQPKFTQKICWHKTFQQLWRNVDKGFINNLKQQLYCSSILSSATEVVMWKQLFRRNVLFILKIIHLDVIANIHCCK